MTVNATGASTVGAAPLLNESETIPLLAVTGPERAAPVASRNRAAPLPLKVSVSGVLIVPCALRSCRVIGALMLDLAVTVGV